jgi:AcrR family transcriptional regulator
MKDPQDHRIRVAAERRSETQERLLLSGLILGSEKPVKEISIEEIYTHAETSRGTFYKYFTGTTGLFKALGLNLANQIVEFLAPLKPSFNDPAIAIATMTRLGIRLAVNIPMLGKLLMQAEWPNADKNTGILGARRRNRKSAKKTRRHRK